MGKYNRPGAMSIMDATSAPMQKAHWDPAQKFMLPADALALQMEIKDMPDLEYICIKPGQYREYIAMVECGFDIETTQVEIVTGTHKERDKNGNPVTVTDYAHHGYMYIWQFCFGDVLVKGRTWAQFHWVMNLLQKRYPELGYNKIDKRQSEQRTVLMAIANEGYEFQYLCKQAYNGEPIVNDVFADSMRRPITASMSWGGRKKAFKAIDVLRIGSLSLKSLGEDYCTTQKLKGDLDYDLMRNSMTPLTEKEIAYCDNDVIILHEYMTYYLETFVRKCKQAPITKTGLVRAAVAWNFLMMGENIPDLVDMFPDNYAEYSTLMKMLYRGGYTHANIVNVGMVIDKVHGMDFTSSYPACALTELFPISKFIPDEEVQADEKVLDEYADKNNKCWYATFRFNNVWATTHHSVEALAKVQEAFTEGGNCTPASKLNAIKEYGMIIDNGRILASKQMTVMLTEQDWKVYRQFYRWDSFEMTDFHCSERGMLPEYIREVFAYFYAKKSELKRAGLSDETAYIVAKQLVNSAYGLMVQTVCVQEVDFDPETGWTTQTNSPEQAYAEAVHKGEYLYDKQGNIREPQYWMPPQYGIWITAHARRRILEAIFYLGDDAIYSDTDSVYFKNYGIHKVWFDNWNKKQEEKNRKIFGDRFDLLGDLGTFDPVEIKWKDEDGKKHNSYEYSFKTWGAKRYIKMDEDGHMEQTIAGLPKGTVIKSIQKKYPEWDDKTAAMHCFDVFKGDLELDLDDSSKLTTAYNDKPHSDVVTDAYGNSETMHEESSVCLYKIPFKMTVDDYYQALVKVVQEDSHYIERRESK